VAGAASASETLAAGQRDSAWLLGSACSCSSWRFLNVEPSGGLAGPDPRRSGAVIETFGALLDGFGIALTR